MTGSVRTKAFKRVAMEAWRAVFRATPWDYAYKLATRAYRRKYETVAEFKEWVDSWDRYVSGHYAHFAVNDEMVLWHLRSQLFELTSVLKRRLGSHLAQPGLFLEAGAADALFMDCLGVRSGVGLNILQECTTQVRAQGRPACQGDIQDLPFQASAFASVICLQTLEHIPNPIKALTELARVCSGTVCVSTPYVETTRIHPNSFQYPLQDSNHVFEFSPADFAKIVTYTPLRVSYRQLLSVFPGVKDPFSRTLLEQFFFPGFYPKLQYYELEHRSPGQ